MAFDLIYKKSMFCKNCRAEIDDKAVICVKCGCPTGDITTSCNMVHTSNISDKSRLIAFLLAFFIGTFGVHRFYLGRVGSGIAMIFTLGGFGIWAMIDWIIILCGSFKDNDGHVVVKWNV